MDKKLHDILKKIWGVFANRNELIAFNACAELRTLLADDKDLYSEYYDSEKSIYCFDILHDIAQKYDDTMGHASVNYNVLTGEITLFLYDLYGDYGHWHYYFKNPMSENESELPEVGSLVKFKELSDSEETYAKVKEVFEGKMLEVIPWGDYWCKSRGHYPDEEEDWGESYRYYVPVYACIRIADREISDEQTKSIIRFDANNELICSPQNRFVTSFCLCQFSDILVGLFRLLTNPLATTDMIAAWLNFVRDMCGHGLRIGPEMYKIIDKYCNYLDRPMVNRYSSYEDCSKADPYEYAYEYTYSRVAYDVFKELAMITRNSMYKYLYTELNESARLMVDYFIIQDTINGTKCIEDIFDDQKEVEVWSRVGRVVSAVEAENIVNIEKEMFRIISNEDEESYEKCENMLAVLQHFLGIQVSNYVTYNKLIRKKKLKELTASITDSSIQIEEFDC